jgi:hypothetical protein
MLSGGYGSCTGSMHDLATKHQSSKDDSQQDQAKQPWLADSSANARAIQVHVAMMHCQRLTLP